MNFFFGIKNKYLSCQLTIPRFQNSGLTNIDYKVFEAKPLNKKWIIKKTEIKENNEFFFIENNFIDNDKIFFLSSDKEINEKYKNDFSRLVNLNHFTDTHPSSFRSNLRIYLKNAGFSSYQSEYPYGMITKVGNILSPIDTLLDSNAETNLIFFRNIFHIPVKEKKYLYIVDILKKEILEKIEITTNTLNEIVIEKKFIKKNIFIFSKQCLGIPLFVSIHNDHISFEHTHPPHHYILSDDKYKIIGNLKSEIYEIINKKNI